VAQWLETETEIRYRIADPAAFEAGSLFPKVQQKNPKIDKIVGRLKGSEEESVQVLIFSKEDWTPEKARGWFKENEEIAKAHGASWMGVKINDAAASLMQDWAKRNIGVEDLLANDPGDPHITVKSALHTQSVKEIAAVVEKLHVATAKMGKIGIFSHPDQDVVYVKIDSPELIKFNDIISGDLAHTDTHTKFTPHATLGFVPNGEGRKFVGMGDFEGKDLEFDKIFFSDREANETVFPLPIKKQVEEKEMNKNIDVDLYFFQKNGLQIHAISFDRKEFSKKSVDQFLIQKELDISTLVEKNGQFSVVLRPESQFLAGSLRDVMLRDGMSATVGSLKKEFLQKHVIEKRLPDRFSISGDLFKLTDLDIDEVTLTAAPAVGKMAEFLIMKSLNAEENNLSFSVPICKIDIKKQQVGGYVLVPNLPDIQKDFAEPADIESGCHSFLKNLALGLQKGSGTGHEHAVFKGIGFPVESFMDHTGVHGVPGGWFLMVKVSNPDVWNRVEKGEIVGFSVGGKGKRTPFPITPENLISKTADEAGLFEQFKQFLMNMGRFFTGKKEEEHKPEELQQQQMPQSGKESGIKEKTKIESLAQNIGKGNNLGMLLVRSIKEKGGEGTEIIARMAQEAGITGETVNTILRGEINCPPIERLEAFSRILGVSIKELRSAAEKDGCVYKSSEEKVKMDKSEVVLKYDIQPSAFDKLSNSGIDVPGLMKSVEEMCKALGVDESQLSKALNINFKVDPGQVGWAGIGIASIVRGVDGFGQFPTTMASTVAKTANTDRMDLEMQAEQYMFKLEEIAKRVGNLEEQPQNPRQSIPGAGIENPGETISKGIRDAAGWDEIDTSDHCFHMGLHKSARELKKRGYHIEEIIKI
jgi:2'-5' RNA ligase